MTVNNSHQRANGAVAEKFDKIPSWVDRASVIAAGAVALILFFLEIYDRVSGDWDWAGFSNLPVVYRIVLYAIFSGGMVHVSSRLISIQLGFRSPLVIIFVFITLVLFSWLSVLLIQALVMGSICEVSFHLVKSEDSDSDTLNAAAVGWLILYFGLAWVTYRLFRFFMEFRMSRFVAHDEKGIPLSKDSIKETDDGAMLISEPIYTSIVGPDIIYPLALFAMGVASVSMLMESAKC